MRALVLGLFLAAVPAFADDLNECIKSCDDIAKLCVDSCAKKTKNNSICKPQCAAVGDGCKQDCKKNAPAKQEESK